MTGENKITFEPGEVIRPEYDPENNLVALYVTDAGVESLREAVSEPQPPGPGPDVADAGPLNGAMPLDSAVLDIGMAVIELNAYVPPDAVSNERP